MRVLPSLLILCAFLLSVLGTSHTAFPECHEKHSGTQMTDIEHTDVAGSEQSSTATEHHHCIAHCFHLQMIPVLTFGIVAWIDRQIFRTPPMAIYESPLLEGLTPPPLHS